MIAKKSIALSVLVALATAPALNACGSGDSTAQAPTPTDQGGGPDGSASMTADGGSGRTPDTETDAHADPGPPCSGKTKPATPDDVWMFAESGDAGGRSARVHVPKGYDPGASMPVVLDFHGYTSNGAQQEALTGMIAKADAAGFIAVHPEGTGAVPGWNAGACCGTAATTHVDDIAFVNAILDRLEDKLCVDAHRIYATGMSNGGFLSHRIACEMSSRIAAVAPVAGVLGVSTCTPSRPIPILHFHGTLDPLVPYKGSAAMGFPSVADSVAGWVKRDACTGEPVETFRNLDAHCSTYQGCAAGSEVTLCTVDGGGHTWPGGLQVPSLGYTTPNLSATDMMWSFFKKHPLP